MSSWSPCHKTTSAGVAEVEAPVAHERLPVIALTGAAGEEGRAHARGDPVGIGTRQGLPVGFGGEHLRHVVPGERRRRHTVSLTGGRCKPAANGGRPRCNCATSSSDHASATRPRRGLGDLTRHRHPSRRVAVGGAPPRRRLVARRAARFDRSRCPVGRGVRPAARSDSQRATSSRSSRSSVMAPSPAFDVRHRPLVLLASLLAQVRPRASPTNAPPSPPSRARRRPGRPRSRLAPRSSADRFDDVRAELARSVLARLGVDPVDADDPAVALSPHDGRSSRLPRHPPDPQVLIHR